MAKRAWVVIVLLAVSLVWPAKAFSQSANPEALAAAKELMAASRMSDQINMMVPAVMQQLKPLIAKGNPSIERDFDALMPIVMSTANVHLDKFLSAGAEIYARHFTADEIRQ